jgi:hypothetical protein
MTSLRNEDLAVQCRELLLASHTALHLSLLRCSIFVAKLVARFTLRGSLRPLCTALSMSLILFKKLPRSCNA